MHTVALHVPVKGQKRERGQAWETGSSKFKLLLRNPTGGGGDFEFNEPLLLPASLPVKEWWEFLPHEVGMRHNKDPCPAQGQAVNESNVYCFPPPARLSNDPCSVESFWNWLSLAFSFHFFGSTERFSFLLHYTADNEKPKAPIQSPASRFLTDAIQPACGCPVDTVGYLKILVVYLHVSSLIGILCWCEPFPLLKPLHSVCPSRH